MVQTHTIVTKVWIAPGCIVCDACENDCPEVFDVQEQTCVIRPQAENADYLAPLTPSILTAAEGCPVEVIKVETKEVEGPAPWPAEAAEQKAPGPQPVHAAAPAGKAAAPAGPPDPRWQALLNTSRISLPGAQPLAATALRRSAEVNFAEQILRVVSLPPEAPPDQRLALLAVGGAYRPVIPLGQRIRLAASRTAQMTRRQFSLSLAVAWGAMAAVGMTFGAMFQDFFGPKVLKEPKSVFRVGRLEEFALPGVYEQYKPQGIWIVNLMPVERRLVALSTICTHLGCIPNWLAGENKFKCPCHGSGYYANGINFEGPTPRPLERFAISVDSDGYVIVDKTRVYRQELGQWDDPYSFISLT